ncbi:MAG TPA: primosomal protein N' [Gemmatimonadota bacterium]|nr:primosomal protein N' [Gemmatimonadota bacterium]
MSRRTCRVALPRPVMQDFAYSVPYELANRVLPGVRVRVPFGPRKEIGLVHEVRDSGDAEAAPARIKPVIAVLDDEPLLDEALLDLCRWVAEYYVAPIGFVYRAALPPGMLTSRHPSGAPPRTQQVVRLTAELPTLLEREEAFGRAGRQREAFETIESMGGTVVVAHLEQQLGFGRSLVRGLVERGLAEIVEETVERDPFETDAPLEPPPASLNPDQVAIVEALRGRLAAAEPGAALIRGVTGSGKTVVYTHVIETALAADRSALILVPEIGLTPQTVARFRAVFGDGIAVLHSGLSMGERHDAWRALRAGRKRVAIGTRSAVFAPLANLGVIVIDEEHDGSYKQSETPRYHARAVAAMRARREGALLVLGSATPSLETWDNARHGRYRLFELERRATAHPLPEVRLIDRRTPREASSRKAATSGDGADDAASRILSDELHAAVDRRLRENRQALLLLNRRGYSTVQQCRACGWIATCPACNVSLTWHRRRARLVCHHCGWEEAAPEKCPSCREPELAFGGVGTEQVERVLGETFPAARIARMDVDTTGGKWAHEKILRRVRDRDVDILLGTQMIAKGLDLPGVTLVGVIDADVGLNLPDFRAAERTFQLLAQVAGRAGRGAEPGEVLVQTLRPDHPALRCTLTHDFVGFAKQEIEDRAGPGYPPHVRLANLVVSGEDETSVADAAGGLAEWLLAGLEATGLGDSITVLGPAPCPIDRLRGRWRWHLLLKSGNAGDLGRLLRYTAEKDPVVGSNRLEIDRDPESLL